MSSFEIVISAVVFGVTGVRLKLRTLFAAAREAHALKINDTFHSYNHSLKIFFQLIM